MAQPTAPRPDRDASDILPSILHLAKLFRTTVETLSLIHASPSNKQYKEQQILMTHLGIQQARLLIWSDILGLTSPPSWVATSYVPKHPSATYPNVDEPMYFPKRDKRLDRPEVLRQLEDKIGTLARKEQSSKKEMMHSYGLRPPKHGVFSMEEEEVKENITLDSFRLDSFREKYDLLLDVAEDQGIKPEIAIPQGAAQAWVINDVAHFATFVAMIRATADRLVKLAGIEVGVERALKIDIRALGWHADATALQAARARQKLRRVTDACLLEYPEYAEAAEEALDNIADQWKGHAAYERNVKELRRQNDMLGGMKTPPSTTRSAATSRASSRASSPTREGDKQKRPAFLKYFKTKSFLGKKERSDPARSNSEYHSRPGTADGEDPPRSFSHVNHQNISHIGNSLLPIRSRSFSHAETRSQRSGRSQKSNDLAKIPTATSRDSDQDAWRNDLDRMTTVGSADPGAALGKQNTLQSMISRHDQWNG